MGAIQVLSRQAIAAIALSQAACFVTVDPGENGPLPSTLPLNANSQLVLRTFKPALAVRGISCLLCHARVQSSIITDFGVTEAQSFIGSQPGTIYGESQYRSNSKPLTLPWFGNYYGTWQLADEIRGSVVVPKATIIDPAFLASLPGFTGTGITFAQLMGLDLGANYYGDAPHSGAGRPDRAVTPAGENPKVVEIEQIYLGAPKASEILALAPALSSVAQGWQTHGSWSSVTGLTVRAGTGGSYVTHEGSTITCKGDVVVQGTLFLNDVTIDTDRRGCRLYVTQSVFIQGRIRQADTSSTQNLQISSARAILMGFNTATLAFRLTQWYPDAQPLTRGPGTNTQKNNAIRAEAAVLGSLLHDSNEAAHCPTTMVSYVGRNGANHVNLTQCGIEYSRLLLNAPNVQSRYVGEMRGVVIAEIALFAPGALVFAYDPVFDESPILPVLPPVVSIPGLGGCTTPGCGGIGN